jgi:pyruvate formate lyase activating enzyme
MKMYPKIYGFNKSSEAGPDNFAPSVFLGACNFRCDYCMNSKLVLDFASLNEVPIEDIETFVKENECEWINVSGGEVTVHPTLSLINMFIEMQSWGCKIAISTNGFLPEKLIEILPHIHYVTMDVKTGIHKYNEVVYAPLREKSSAIFNVMNSLFLLRMTRKRTYEPFDYELRTTMYRPLVGKEEIEEIGMLLRKEERWMLQPFRQAKCMIGEDAYKVEPYTEEEMKDLLEFAKQYSDNAFIRYV